MDKTSEPRVGVYICHCGGNISDVVDVQRLADRASQLPGVVVARTHMFMCSDPGQESIIEDIDREKLDRVVVASCSPRLHEQTFRSALQRAGLNPYLYEHANIREQVSWVTHSHDAATDKASRLVAAAVAKARLLEPLDPIRVDARRHAVVIGGGVSGLKSARDLAARGVKVTLVEKSPFLGGQACRLDRVYPTGDRVLDLLEPLIQEVVGSADIDVITNAEVVSAEGYVGNFHLKIRERPRGVKLGIANLEKAVAACPVEVDNEYDSGLSKRKAIYRPHPGCHPPAAAIDWQACNRCGRCLEVAGEGIDLDMEPAVFEVNAGVVLVATGFEHYEPGQGEFGFRDQSEVVTLPQLIRLVAEQRDNGVLRWQGRAVRNIAMIHCVGSRQIEGVHEPREGEHPARVLLENLLYCDAAGRQRAPRALP